MLQIKRAKDSRVIKSILHRGFDVPGGVTVKTSELDGTALVESTPIGYDSTDTMWHVTKTATLVTEAAADAVTYQVAKGSHFKVGDVFATEGANGKAITGIDKATYTDKDVITLATTLGAIIPVGTVGFQSTGANKVVKYPPTAIVGSNEDIDGSNLFVPAFLQAVVRTGNAPGVNATLTGTLKGIIYIV